MPLISVIVPVYNNERYLVECIESVLYQSFQDFELLLINDGSTDRSGKICDDYAKKDARIQVFHTENGGVSSARNLGIEKAVGEWIAFVDSDDYIDADYLYNFYNNLVDDCDLLIQGIKQKGISAKVLCSFRNKKITDMTTFLSEYSILPYFFGPTSKLFKRKLIISNNVRYDNSISYAEDTLFNLDYAKIGIKKIVLINENGYNYRITKEGLSSKLISFKQRLNLLYEIKARLIILTTNKQHYYWYIVETINTLYTERIDNSYIYLKKISKDFRAEILYIYANKGKKASIVHTLIKYRQYYLLNYLLNIFEKSKSDNQK